MYKPDTEKIESVELTPELEKLIEDIANKVHDEWAVKRISEGWVYGDKKSGEKKTTPLLVPYEELPEEEKEYDRATARTVVKCLLAAGYKIV